MSNIPVISFVAACSGMGKTTLIRKLLKGLKENGYRVAVIKHGEHLNLPPADKDSSLFLAEGAEISLISTPEGWLMMGIPEEEVTLDEFSLRLETYQVDLILVEGYKGGDQPKVELHREVFNQGLICPINELLAVVSDETLPIDLPQFGFDDIDGIIGFIITYIKGA